MASKGKSPMRALPLLIVCCIYAANFAFASGPAQRKKHLPNGTTLNRGGSFSGMQPTAKNKINRRNTTKRGKRFKSFGSKQTTNKIPYHFPKPGGMVSIEKIPSGQLTDAQIINLFSNKIVKGNHLRRGFSFKRHFRLDGFLIEKSPQRGERSGYWRTNKDCLCTRLKNKKEKCVKIIKENGKINQYRVKKSGDKVRVVTYEEFFLTNDDG
jgi:hypothetical protein